VEITGSQLRAYYDPSQFHPKAKAWELWNVENLSKNSNSPQIKIYQELYLEELDPRSFSLDLRKSKWHVVWKV
jgi:hypothetical protein